MGPGHPERPGRLHAILKAAGESGLDLKRVDPPKADEEDLLRVHPQEHLDKIKRVCFDAAHYPDPDVDAVPASWDAALTAAGAGIAACKGVMDGTYRRAFCAVRPPGHHCETARAMGFCLFNSGAIAARWLQAEAGVQRVAIFDFDVHHGNGHQEVFYDDDTVCYISIHQHPHYPGTGFPGERGKNGTNLNIQMPPLIEADAWLEATHTHVRRQLDAFDPQFLILSAGFDAHRDDMLGNQLLEARHFEAITRDVLDVAGGRIVSMLEGGYHLGGLSSSVAAHLSALAETAA